MHTVIYAWIEASNEPEAITNGKAVFDTLVSEARVRRRIRLLHDVRWRVPRHLGDGLGGDPPPAVAVDSPAGEDLLNQVWSETEDEFTKQLDRVRDLLGELSDEQIMRDEKGARSPFPPNRTVRGSIGPVIRRPRSRDPGP